jgi:DNA-binding protein Fis
LIVKTLQHEEGSQTRAAAVLGIKRTTLRYKMEKYQLIEGDGLSEEDDD